MTETDVALLVEAANFAAWKHRDQRRKGGDVPYINHPLGVAGILTGTGAVTDVVTLAAALLHDTLEDTDTTREELERRFGAEVAGVVAEVSDDKGLRKVERKRAQIEHGQHLSRRAKLVKLADKLHNLRDLATRPPPSWDAGRVRGYFCWAHEVVAQIGAVDDGLWGALEAVFATELEVEGATVRVVPEDPGERAALLESYYAEMSVQKVPGTF